MESIVIKEYSEKDINENILDKLDKYVKCKKLNSALKVTRHGVKTKSWVGVIKYKKYHFQILPKFIHEYSKNNENAEKEQQEILNNLIFMLSYTKKLDIKTSNSSKISTSKNPFIEILIREYANSLFDCLKCFTPKRYIREEDNLRYLKGKIKFSENIKYNCINKERFYCEYDEFSENNLLNQLFLFVSTCLYNISENSLNKKNLKFIINYYSNIDFVRFDKFKIKNIKLSRNQELFEKSFNLAKMFVEQTSVDLSNNKFENITLVWDMNKLFEEFIYEVLKIVCIEKGYKISPQKGRRLLIGDNSKKRNTFVDIMIQKGADKIVIDTKYKKFENVDSFSNSDVFQVSTYCLLHNAQKAILLYPQCTINKPQIPQFSLNATEEDNRLPINFTTINLQYKNLKNEIPKIKEELKCLLINISK